MNKETKSHVDAMLLNMADTYLEAHKALRKENDELKQENAELKARLARLSLPLVAGGRGRV